MCTITDIQIKPPKYAYKVIEEKDGKFFTFFTQHQIKRNKVVTEVPNDLFWDNETLTKNPNCITAFLRKKDAMLLLKHFKNRCPTTKLVRLRINEKSKCFVGDAANICNAVFKKSNTVVTIAVNKYVIDKYY